MHHAPASILGDQKRMPDPLELELQVILSHVDPGKTSPSPPARVAALLSHLSSLFTFRVSLQFIDLARVASWPEDFMDLPVSVSLLHSWGYRHIHAQLFA